MVPLAKSANETQSEEEPCKSRVSSLWSPFLYMLIKNGHNLTILALINFLKLPLYSSCPPIKIVYKKIT